MIGGILQIGVGVPDLPRAFAWYRRHFGMDIPVVQETSESSPHMLPLTGGARHHRMLAIIVNLQGGGGLELCQFTRRPANPAGFEPQLGDCGVFSARIKARDAKAVHRWFKNREVDVISDVLRDCSGRAHFFVKDPQGLLFQIAEGDDWFSGGKLPTGGISGFTAGVSNMDCSVRFYRHLLGYDSLIYDEEGVFADLSCLPGGRHPVRRILLTHSQPRRGAFSRLLGASWIELIQALERSPRRLYDGRIWGDPGFFQVAFDMRGMEALERECAVSGVRFILNSKNAVDVGDAEGHYSYIADPDGTLIEFIETCRIPLIRRLRWYLDLRKRPPEKSIPDWMLKTLRLNRVKD
jgi:catechol 2,3-dioxygenase-like lactoylglutathione lyase family enzyme